MEFMRYLSAFGFQASDELTQLTAPLGQVKASVLQLSANHCSLALALEQPLVLGGHCGLQRKDREGRTNLIGGGRPPLTTSVP